MAKKITWDAFVRNLLFLYYHRDNITYCLGCSGEVVGRDEIVKNQFIYYYDNGWAEKIGDGLVGWKNGMNHDQAWALWSAQHDGKMAFDCSGLGDWSLGYQGVHKYSSWDFGEMEKQENLVEGVCGSALWKKGHVGYDIGFGYMVEIGKYNDTIWFNKISDRDFTSSHKITDVNYSGATNR